MRKGGEECEDRDRCTYSLVGRQRTMEAWQDLDDYPFATLGRRSLPSALAHPLFERKTSQSPAGVNERCVLMRLRGPRQMRPEYYVFGGPMFVCAGFCGRVLNADQEFGDRSCRLCVESP